MQVINCAAWHGQQRRKDVARRDSMAAPNSHENKHGHPLGPPRRPRAAYTGAQINIRSRRNHYRACGHSLEDSFVLASDGKRQHPGLENVFAHLRKEHSDATVPTVGGSPSSPRRTGRHLPHSSYVESSVIEAAVDREIDSKRWSRAGPKEVPAGCRLRRNLVLDIRVGDAQASTSSTRRTRNQRF